MLDDAGVIGRLIIYHNSITQDDLKKLKWKKITEIGVDTGQAGFYDFANFKNYADTEGKSLAKGFNT